MSASSSVRRLPLLGMKVAPARTQPPTLLDQLLADQRDGGTAVETFARQHDRGELPSVQDKYRALLPLAAPKAGEQYAFEVDLDACTGCKACVTGCHNRNGLDDDETWRSVGLLTGGSAEAPLQQTVTTACHHCLEPACAIGCPVLAYEKDPVTGIVAHLDDQCIGCQYCIFMCPYDVPKFNPARGIVRKCDLCSDRLAHGEAPACVQACPSQAIRINVVDQAEVVEAAQASRFLPGVPSPEHTLPTTTYRTRKELPRNLLPADFYALSPERPHPPLIVMLVLTQLSVGAFCVELMRSELLGAAIARGVGHASAAVALALGLAALALSVLHLGRPLYAFRAMLGLRRSWLSREILAFSLFAGVASGYAASLWLPASEPLRALLLRGSAVSGLVGVVCSVMVYAATRRPTWHASSVAFKFLASGGVLGAATVAMIASLTHQHAPAVAQALALLMCGKLTVELAAFRHLRRRAHTAHKRSAMLMAGDLRRVTTLRFVCGALGGIALPFALWHLDASQATVAAVLGIATFALTLGGELCERYLFFVTASAAKMPGGLA